MMKKIMLAMLPLILIAVPALGLVQAQEDTSAPLYVRFCESTRRALGEEPIAQELANAQPFVDRYQNLIAQYDTGQLTALQGVADAELLLADWDATPRAVNCLAPFYMDMRGAISELLIGMLYWQTIDVDNRDIHISNSKVFADRVRNDSANAISFLDIPLPDVATPDPLVVTATPEPTNTPDPNATEEPATLRSSEELSNLLTEYLQDNNITVLRSASVQAFPNETFVFVQLDRFTAADGTTFDYENSLFTMDVIADLVADWQELDDISRVIIETWVEQERVLYVESTGENFRARYIEDTLTQEDFEFSLFIELPGAGAE